MNASGHFRTITKHKLTIMKYCFRAGLYKQGIMHDLSKYTPTEFIPGARYYQGNRSPNNAQREAEGSSTAWLHHKGRNKHHLEYWIDYPARRAPEPGPDGRISEYNAEGSGTLAGSKMPPNYVIEMFLDRIAACKTYQGEAYTDKSPLEYYNKGRSLIILHPASKRLLEKLLVMLAQKGEAYTMKSVRWLVKDIKSGRILY